jgi:hypothetical protein
MKAMRFQWLVHTCLGSWAVLMVIIGASLMVNHWVPLPRPELEQSVGKTSLAGLQTVDAENRWVAIHFLYADCPCSRRVLDHLLEQPPRMDVSELVVLIGDAEELALKAEAQGYAVDAVAPEELLAKYGVEAAPLLMVFDTTGQQRYVGGYTSRKQLLNIQDRVILEKLQSGQEVEPLPLFGCAVSARLKSLVDPFGLKSN